MFFVGTMPFNSEQFNYNSFSIILLGAHTLVSIFISRDLKPFTSILFISFISFYVLHAIGYLYSENKHEAGLLLERKLSLIVFPIVLFYSPKHTIEEIKQVLLTFVFSCITICLISFTTALVIYRATRNTDVFYYHDLSKHVGMHAAYLSLYLCFSIAILLFVFYKESKAFGLLHSMAYYGSIAFLAITVVALSSRAQIVLLAIGLLCYTVIRLELYANKLKLIGGTFIIAVVFIGLILISPRVRERFKAAINYKGEFAMSKKWGEQQMRFLIWDSALELIKEKPVFGKGTGDVQDELQRIYIKNERVSLTYFANTRFNAHNQFFESAIALGFIGLLIFSWGIIMAVKRAYKSKNALYFVFITLFVVSCLTESMLERQNGIVFFAFFNSFLILNNTTVILSVTKINQDQPKSFY
jgi:O-antigen ligase